MPGLTETMYSARLFTGLGRVYIRFKASNVPEHLHNLESRVAHSVQSWGISSKEIL